MSSEWQPNYQCRCRLLINRDHCVAFDMIGTTNLASAVIIAMSSGSVRYGDDSVSTPTMLTILAAFRMIHALASVKAIQPPFPHAPFPIFSSSWNPMSILKRIYRGVFTSIRAVSNMEILHFPLSRVGKLSTLFLTISGSLSTVNSARMANLTLKMILSASLGYLAERQIKRWEDLSWRFVELSYFPYQAARVSGGAKTVDSRLFRRSIAVQVRPQTYDRQPFWSQAPRCLFFEG